MKGMKVIILQTDIRWANPGANRAHVEELMDSCPDADLYVLPEMFSTGFCTQPEGGMRDASVDEAEGGRDGLCHCRKCRH